MIYTSTETVESVNKVRKSLWRFPVADRFKTIWWIYTWPIKFILTITIPNPKTYRRLYPLSFLMCILWIGLNAYMIVWMITVIGIVETDSRLCTVHSNRLSFLVDLGFTFAIPEAVMGLTFLAAGGCMPEGISSVLMIRKNQGGVGVSNSLGANSLAILMSLGIPWLIKNILHRNTAGKNFIPLNPLSTEYNIMLLLCAVIALYLILTVAKYQLKRTVGFTLITVYSIFITLGILLEMNVFFPGVCS